MDKKNNISFLKSFRKALLVLLLLGSGIDICSSQILTFEFAGVVGDEATLSSNSNDVNLSSSTISRGSGLTAAANADRFNATNWATTAGIDATDYMEFTVTPNAGYEFSVSSIVVQLQRSGTGPRAIQLRGSADGYTATLGSAAVISDVTTSQSFTFTFTQTSSSAITYRVYMYNSEALTGTCGIGDMAGNDIVVNGTVTLTAPTPTITVSPATLTNFVYVSGNGPSSTQTFTCSGVNLTANISLTAPTNYEISTSSGSGFGSSLTLTQSGGSVSATTIYVRLKAGLAVGSYNTELVTASSTGAASKSVSCSGDVIASGVYINEIFVDPSDSNDGANMPNTSEWLELYNANSSAVDISCWFITDGDFAVTIPSVTTIPAGGYFTIASAAGSGQSPDLDWALCGCTSGTAGQVGIFTNGGEQLALYNSGGTLVDAVIWGAGQLPGSMTTSAVGSCGSQSVTFPGAGSFENIGTVSNGTVNERTYDGSSSWQQTATGTFGSTNSINPLPVELIDFSAKTAGNTIEISWVTATETHNDFFTVERSKDAVSFESIGIVNGAGSSSSINRYRQSDFQPYAGINYYRLKQTDFDGNYTYSGIIAVAVNDFSIKNVFPNPATTILNIRLSGRRESVCFEVVSLQGITLLKKEIENEEDQHLSLDLQGISAGTYILKTTTDGNSEQTLFVKQ